MRDDLLLVGVLGYGAIGKVVAGALAEGEVPGAALTGVCTGTARTAETVTPLPFDALVERSNLVVECAGHEAVASLGPCVLDAGCDLLLVSIGALADEAVLDSLRRSGPGRVLLSTGALGGIDLIRAVALAGGLHRVRLVTTKPLEAFRHSPAADEMQLLDGATGPVLLFDGSAREAAARFPRSANVAAALALAAGGWDRVEAAVVADPAAQWTRHEIECSAEMGEYRFTISNRPSSLNAATSEVVPYAVLRALTDEAAADPWRFR